MYNNVVRVCVLLWFGLFFFFVNSFFILVKESMKTHTHIKKKLTINLIFNFFVVVVAVVVLAGYINFMKNKYKKSLKKTLFCSVLFLY